jgi:flagellar biosynthetic protein FliQ
MNVDVLYEIIKICLTEAMLIMAPIVLVTLAIGVVISILQTITSIQEQTITFVPKLLGAALTLWVTAPWMLQELGKFMTQLIQRSGELAR